MASSTTDRRLGLVGNTAVKAPVTVVATSNVTLSGEQTIDGIALSATNAAGVPDRVLCTAQTTASENGIWDVSTAAWTRSADANGNYDLTNGTQVVVQRGSAAKQIWILTTANPITIGTTSQTWSQNLSAGFLATLAATGGSDLIGFDASTGYAVNTIGWAFQQAGVLLNTYGTVDSTGATNTGDDIQTIIDANKGKRIMFGPGTYLVSGIELSGATYDGTVLECLPGATLKLAADGGNSTFGGAWVGVLIEDADRCGLINMNWDGNKSAMTATREQIFCMGVAGAEDYFIVGSRIRDIQGDGVYVGQKDWTSNTATPKRGLIRSTYGYNATTSGRNLVTVISAEQLDIDDFTSINIGGVIDGTTMPGGLCIEPDNGYQTCADIRVTGSRVVSAGTSGIGLLGKAVTNDATRDWNAQRITFKDCQVKVVSGASTGPVFSRCGSLTVDVDVEQTAGTRVRGAVIYYADIVRGRVSAVGGSYGVDIGPTGSVTDIVLDVHVTDYNDAGLRTGEITGGKFTGRIYGAASGVYSFAIQTSGIAAPVTQTNVTYSIDAPSDGTNLRAFRNEPAPANATYVNTFIKDCDFTGYASVATACDAVIPVSSVWGMDLGGVVTFTDGDTTPSVGAEAEEYAFSNSAPTTVTMFDNQREGRRIRVRMGANTTITHNASYIYCKGAANITGRTAVDFVEFVCRSNVWYEQFRSW